MMSSMMRLFAMASLIEVSKSFMPSASKQKFVPPITTTRRHEWASTRIGMADASEEEQAALSSQISKKFSMQGNFDLSTALFCGGLAFDAYVEPPPNSARWEKGSQGVKVAFVSNAYTRQLYKGILEVVVQRVSGLPDGDDNAVEKLVTGDGVDACVLTAAVEGSWKEDVRVLEKEQFHEGVFDLSGSAHVVRTSTAWANIDEKQSQAAKKRRGWASPYHVKGGWGKAAQAVWPEESPMFLYVQDPATVRLVFTVLDADRVGTGRPIGSTYKKLSSLIPQAALTQEELIDSLKQEMLEAVKRGEVDLLDESTKIQLGAKTWQGDLKLTSKPRKKDKNSQIMAGAAAGAYLAGPVGAAAGAVVASFYEGQIQGTIKARLRYLPIPQLPAEVEVYDVKGGTPGVDWGKLFSRHREKTLTADPASTVFDDLEDFEHCFFINHDKTGATCAVYRSIKRKLIVVSFRGTCAPVDLVTDASLVQEAWVDGEDIEDQTIKKVHAGFRGSLSSISRRLKELILAVPAPGDSFADYDMLVTGHSLGGALATLFTTDIAEYGVDAGRGLPQLEESDPWWKSIASTFGGKAAEEAPKEPPRPKSLRVYSFGSPRVGNEALADHFDSLLRDGKIHTAYRIVNGDDVVARMPRTMNALVLGQVKYDHCGPTVLISQPKGPEDTDEEAEVEVPRIGNGKTTPLLWIEGESDDSACPVRDGKALTSPMAEGSLLSDLISSTKDSFAEDSSGSLTDKFSSAVGQITSRLSKATAGDVVGVLGINQSFSEREAKMIQALFQGKALAHHLEDEYYKGMGRAGGFLARVNEELEELEESPFS